MSAVVYFPNLRLAKALRQPGGKRVGLALRDSQAGLDSIAANCLATVDRLLAELDLVWNEIGAAPTANSLRRLYDCSGELIGIGRVAGLPALDQAAHGLCDLLDGMMSDRAISIEPIEMRIGSLHLLRRMDIGVDAIAEALASIERVRARLLLVAATPTDKDGPTQGVANL